MRCQREERCKCAWRLHATGPVAEMEFASPWPIPAAAFPAIILGRSSSLFTPRRKMPGPASDCGFRAASCKNMADRFACAAGLPGARRERYFRSLCLSDRKSAASPDLLIRAVSFSTITYRRPRYSDFRHLEATAQSAYNHSKSKQNGHLAGNSLKTWNLFSQLRSSDWGCALAAS